jgi:hypothetical protein
MKRSLEVLKEKLDSLKKDRPYWSTKIDEIHKDIDNNKIGVEGDAEFKLKSLKKEADEAPPNTSGMAGSAKVKSILDALNDYRNAYATYHHHP